MEVVVMNTVQRLELNWIGKHDPKNKISPEPRILIENPKYSYSNSEAMVNEQLSFGKETKNKIYFDNMLIHGDNLLALKSLELEYAGKIKCIYIDPPYNTGSAFEHYDDNLEHSAWLNLMKPRLELLKTLLSEDGVIFISIDDEEYPYLRILCDEIFGRSNFIGDLVWQKKRGGGNDSKFIAVEHEYIISIAKNIRKLENWNVKYDEKYLQRYSEQDEKGRYFWDTFARPGLRNPLEYEIEAPDGSKILNGWIRSKSRFEQDYKNGDIRIVKKSDNKWSVQFKQYMGKGKKPRSLLTNVAVNSDAKNEIKYIFGDAKYFSYPKPENLIKTLLEMSTTNGDIVLDSFLGSGTTAAVAHKMGRRWIGIELGNHAYTHCYKRLKAVVDGEQGGISKDVNWKGGGGFKFYELAPSLIEKDKFGNPVISDKYTGEMLAKAIAKHKGYYYQPDEHLFWKQSKNGDKNFLYVTENHITPQDLDYIHTLMKQDEHLLICTMSYESECSDQFPNITIQQIPKVLFGKCDFMKEGYSLNVNQNENSKEDNCNE